MLNLKETTISYLTDAGFSADSFILDDKDNNYIEINFLSNDAVEYIIDDIFKSEYKNILEIKKYKSKTGNLTAIITFCE